MMHGKELEQLRQHDACGNEWILQVGTIKTIIQNCQQLAVELFDGSAPRRFLGRKVFGQMAVLQSSSLGDTSGGGAFIAVGREFLDRRIENRTAIGNCAGTRPAADLASQPT